MGISRQFLTLLIVFWNTFSGPSVLASDEEMQHAVQQMIGLISADRTTEGPEIYQDMVGNISELGANRILNLVGRELIAQKWSIEPLAVDQIASYRQQLPAVANLADTDWYRLVGKEGQENHLCVNTSDPYFYLWDVSSLHGAPVAKTATLPSNSVKYTDALQLLRNSEVIGPHVSKVYAVLVGKEKMQDQQYRQILDQSAAGLGLFSEPEWDRASISILDHNGVAPSARSIPNFKQTLRQAYRAYWMNKHPDTPLSTFDEVVWDLYESKAMPMRWIRISRNH